MAEAELLNDLRNNPKTKAQLVDAATKGLIEETAKDLLARFNDPKNKANPEKRRLMLQLAFVYATEKHKAALRSATIQAIIDEAEHESIRTAALELHQPLEGDGFQDDAKDLKQVVDLFEKRTSSIELMKAYGRFISNFSDEHAQLLIKLLREQNARPTSARIIYGLSGMGNMKSSGQDTRVLKYFVDMAIDPDENTREWGVTGLKQITKDKLKLVISKNTRQDLLMVLLKKISEPHKEDEVPIVDKDGLTSLIIASLLNPEEDADFVKGLIGFGPRSESKGLQVLLFNVALRLAREPNKQVPAEIVETLYGVNDVFAGGGTARLLTHALQFGDQRDAQAFLKRFPQLDAGPVSQEVSNWDKPAALRAAIEGDARSNPPFLGTVTLLRSKGDTDDKAHFEQIKKQVSEALRGYCKAHARQLSDLALLRSVVANEDARSVVHELYSPAIAEAYRNVIGQVEIKGNWNGAIEMYGKVMQQDPTNPEWHYGRGKVYFDKLRMGAEALGDVSKAIELAKVAKAERYEFYDKKAEIRRNLPGEVKVAIEDYKEALRFLSMGQVRDKGKDPTKAKSYRPKLYKLHHKMALAYILDDEKDQAEAHINEAIKLAATQLEKAETSENLGLLYLRRGDWNAALKKSKEVAGSFRYTAWNWIIQYIAATTTGDQQEADFAYRTWLAMRLPNNLAALYDFIPELLRDHLDVTPIERARLKADSSVPGVKGKRIAALHPLNMEAGKKYVVDMESLVFDSYLILQDPMGRTLAENDDGGGGLNARLEFTPEKTGTYRVVATTLGGNSQGAYTLIVRELPGDKK
jgi:tetratricopeptide (TPR) repeat protein